MLLVSGNFEKEIKDLVKNASSYSNGTSLDVLQFSVINGSKNEYLDSPCLKNSPIDDFGLPLILINRCLTINSNKKDRQYPKS